MANASLPGVKYPAEAVDSGCFGGWIDCHSHSVIFEGVAGPSNLVSKNSLSRHFTFKALLRFACGNNALVLFRKPMDRRDKVNQKPLVPRLLILLAKPSCRSYIKVTEKTEVFMIRWKENQSAPVEAQRTWTMNAKRKTDFLKKNVTTEAFCKNNK